MSDALEFAKKRIALIAELAEMFGNKKVNLIRPGTDRREGIWCVPLTAEDARKMNDDDWIDEKFHAYLSNMPLPWGERCWGAEIIGTTCGLERPKAFPEDQASLDAETALLFQGLREYEALMREQESPPQVH